MRRALLALVIASTGVASAQPADPYGQDPAPPPPPPPNQPADPYGPAPAEASQEQVLAEQVAQSLVQRAQDLFDARVFVDAKQLAVEALVTSPKGAAAEHAKSLIAAINKQLGLSGGEPAKVAPPPLPTPVVPPPVAPPPEETSRGPLVTPARVHGGLYLGLIGTALGSAFSKSTPAAGAVPLGIVGAAGGALLAPIVTRKLGFRDAQIRTAGTGSVWLGVVGGFIADAVKVDGTTSRQVLAGASIGSSVGLLAFGGLATRNRYTEGDVALVDTLAGIGVFGGLSLGMLMQPAEGEAYSVNAVLGAAGGVLVGLIAAPNTNTTPRRMLRVAGLAAAGGGVPFLLYAAIHDPGTHADERVVGALSTIGVLAGAYVGFRLTRDLDVDQDVLPTKDAPVDDAPPAVVGRSSRGRWGLGTVGITPLSRELAPQPGLAVPLVGAAW